MLHLMDRGLHFPPPTALQPKTLIRLAGVFAAAAPALLIGFDAFSNYPWIPFDDPAIAYMQRAPNDRVARLQQQIETGAVKLRYDEKHGYLPDLLKRLDINTDSQMLVFSKTSFQAPRISPINPRALYFNDDVLIGSVHNGEVLEVMALDPAQGVQFYSLDVHKSASPAFVRRDMACLQCHMSPATLNVPGLLVTSSYVSTDGTPAFRGSQQIVDHRTPLAERWGGWYVNGTAGSLQHRGNSAAPDPSQPTAMEPIESGDQTKLPKRVGTSVYLEPTSDIVALLTLEHQTRMTNLMTRFGWETRVATAGGKPDGFEKRLDEDATEMATYMLFADEAKMRDPIAGVSTFTKTFAARGPRDQKGRSLRDFDLQHRLFKYPLSYMIYSEAFDKMPDLLKDRVYRKLYDVLTGKDTSPTFARLSPEDRRNVMEILLDTKAGLPGYWREPSSD